MTQFTTGHVGLNVTDLANSQAFYVKIFGFEVDYENEDAEQRYAFLSDGQRTVLTLWQQSEERFADNRSGLHHLSFKVESIQDILEIERKLRDDGMTIIYDGIVPHGEGESSAALFFEDPDGIRLEVYTKQGGEAYQAPHSDAPSCGFF